MFTDAILTSLARKVRLPDMEFLANLGDWPLQQDRDGPPAVPVVSWCGSADTHDIVLPTWELTRSTLEALEKLGPDSVDALSVQGAPGPP